MDHPLTKRGRAIDWRFLEEQFGAVYSAKVGDPPLPTLLMAGLSYDAEDFVNQLRSMNATPHVAQSTKRPLAGASGRLGEPDRKPHRRHPLEPDPADVAALAALDLEPHVDDSVRPIVFGFAPQGLDRRLTVGFGAGIAGGAPGPFRPDSPNRNCTPAVVKRGRKTHSHEVQSIS
jgi:hypothetical protein